MDSKYLQYEFMRPLCSAWREKLAAAKEARKPWKEVADECLMFYGHSASAMWNEEYSKKFWKNVKLPRFRVTINKAFEYVAIYAPNLMWDYPSRDVSPKKPIMEIGPEMFDPALAQVIPYFQQQQAQQQAVTKGVAAMMREWLNYTAREAPGGGLARQSRRSVLDSLIFGRGLLFPRPYQMPGSQSLLTGAFHESPFNLLIDPEFDKLEDSKWVAVIHYDTYRDVEDRFGLERGSLKGKASIESTTAHAELSTDDGYAIDRKSGKCNDTMMWVEIFSKAGCGCRYTNMEPEIRDHMDDVVGEYAYIAIAPDVDYPLNCPAYKIRQGMTDEEVKAAFSWPIEFWRDGRWPFEALDYNDNPQSVWPIPPLAPGLGELKLLNFLVSWLANRVWTSSRDFWAVAGPHVDHYREYLLNGEDQCIIPTPFGVDDIRKAVTVLQQPETRQDMENLIAFVSDMFDKRVMLTPFMYGLNQDGTQNRTAEETIAKSRAVSSRPEFMQKQVAEWMGRVTQSEAIVTKMFVKGKDASPVVGMLGAMAWDQHISNSTIESIMREYDYTVEASSMLRPNRDRDIANFQQVTGLFLPIVQGYAEQSGNYDVLNGFMDKWAELHDEDLTMLHVPPKEVTPEQQQMSQLQMAQLQAEVQKTNAEAQQKMADAQAITAEAGNAQALAQLEMQMQMQTEQMKAQAEQLKMQAEDRKAQLAMNDAMMKMQMAQQKAQLDIETLKTKAQVQMVQDNQKHQQDMAQDAAKAQQDMQQAAAMGAVQLQVAQAQADQKLITQDAMGQQQIEQQKAKTELAKKQAKNPPKPKGPNNGN